MAGKIISSRIGRCKSLFLGTIITLIGRDRFRGSESQSLSRRLVFSCMNRRIYQYRKCRRPFVHCNSNHRKWLSRSNQNNPKFLNLFNTINAKVSTAESNPSHNYAGDQGGREFFKPLGNLLAKRHLDPRFLGTIVHPLTQEEGRLLKKKKWEKDCSTIPML